jgi:hypothetical protein
VELKKILQSRLATIFALDKGVLTMKQITGAIKLKSQDSKPFENLRSPPTKEEIDMEILPFSQP